MIFLVNRSMISTFRKLNNYHPNIKLAIEVKPSKFLNTEMMIKNGIIEATTGTRSLVINSLQEV